MTEPTLTRYFIEKETRIDVNGTESHLCYILEKMVYYEEQILTMSLTHSAQGTLPNALTVDVQADGQFRMADQRETLKGHGKLYGGRGRWNVIAIEEGIVDIPQFNIYLTFTGHYLFHDNALTSLKTWFAQASDDPLFFSVQRGISISANAFEQVYGEPQTLPQFWKRAADER